MPKLTLDIRHLIRQCPECSRRYSRDAVFCPFDGGRLVEAPRPDDGLDPLLGQTVDGRYAIEGVVGEGGMGTVYRARHVALGRTFALKVLRADLAQEAELAARFLQEAQATAAVKNPNVVSITDSGRMTDGRPYFVMELLSGRTLASLLKAGGALPPREAARIAVGVASGLEAAHAAGVIHRDLKPENVFLLGEDAGGGVRVVDFGAAMIVGASRLTKAGIVFGTPHYMSPEQAAGKEVDRRADVYALGIILYEMLTGRVPFEGDTYMGVLTQHMFVAPRPPSELVPELGGRLGAIEAVVLRALEKDPAARFQSMAELEEAVTAAIEARGVGPSWPSPPPRTSAPPRGIADDLELPTMGEIRERVSAVDGLDRRARGRKIVVAALAASGVVLGAGFGVRLYSAKHAASATTTTATATVAPAATVPATATVVRAATVPATAAAAPSTNAAGAPPPPSGAAVSPSASAPPVQSHAHAPRRSHPHKASASVTSTLGPDPFER